MSDEKNVLSDLLYNQPDTMQENNSMHKKFAQVSMRDLCVKYKEQGLLISDLTLSKYKHMFESNPKNLIPVLPKLPLSNSLTNSGMKNSQRNQFLDTKDLVFLRKELISHIEGSNMKDVGKSLFRNFSQQNSIDFDARIPNKYMSTNKYLSTKTSMATVSDNVSYGPWEELQFQLNHNKGQLIQNLQQQQKDFDFDQRKLKEHKMPKIKVQPTKRFEEQQEQVQRRESIHVQFVPIVEELQINHVFWTEKECKNWRPQMREGHTLTASNKKFYCYGGISNQKHADMSQFEPLLCQWKNIEGFGDRPSFGRNNHSAIAYKKMIYIFGGEKKFDTILKLRECAFDFRSFNTETYEWKQFKPNGDTIEGRRGHQMVVVGKNIVIIGGVSSKGHYRNDVYHMDIPIQKLSMAYVEDHQFFSNGIAFNTATSIYNFDKQPQLYVNQVHDENDSKIQKVKEQGIYVLGGEDVKGNYYQDLYILRTNLKPMQWAKLETKGQLPCARIRHSAVYHATINILVIHGGINEKFQFLNDIHMLRIDTLQWILVKNGGKVQELRAGHCAVLDERRMMIFGGYNAGGFVNGEVQCLELDTKVAQKSILQLIIDSTSEKDLVSMQTIQLKKDQIDNQYIRKQVDKLNYRNLNSFLPMPVKFKMHEPYVRMNQQQTRQMELIKQETSHFVMHELDELERSKGAKDLKGTINTKLLPFMQLITKKTIPQIIK